MTNIIPPMKEIKNKLKVNVLGGSVSIHEFQIESTSPISAPVVGEIFGFELPDGQSAEMVITNTSKYLLVSEHTGDHFADMVTFVEGQKI